MFPGAPVAMIVMSDDAKKQVAKKIEIAERLAHWIVKALPVRDDCIGGLESAIRDFLCVDLEQVHAMRDAFPIMNRATIDDLTRAQQSLEATRQKIEFFEGHGQEPSDDPLQEGMNVGARLLGGIYLPDLRLTLQREEETVSAIQKALEEQGGEADASHPPDIPLR